MTALGHRLAGLTAGERALLFERLRAKKAQGADRMPQTSRTPRILPRDRALDPPPLSFAQQRLWFLDRLRPGDPVYNIASALQVTGPLDPAALRRALAAVVARHESLRTTFGLAGAVPVQVIAPAAEARLLLADLSGLAPAEREREVARLCREEARRPFELAAGPLLRAVLLRLSAARHVLLFTQHHIVSDGWSSGVLSREVMALYSGAALPELPVQYADFAVWQRQWLTGEVLERQVDLWRRRLAGAPAVLDLPTDRPRPALRTTRGNHCKLRLPAEAAARLKALARELSATPFTVLLAAWQALLHRVTGQEDLCVAAPVANRDRREIAGLIGFFVNTLVLRGDLSGDPGFGELVSRLREVALEAFAHQDLPFEKLVEKLRPERGFRVEPGEVEAALRRQSAVRDAAVVARGGSLVAFVVTSEEPEVFRGYLREKLPAHMVPASIEILDRLPLNPHGKVDRRVLAARPVTRAEIPLAPRSELEATLASLWAEVLGLPRVGVEESFFDLGGHSLLLARLQTRLAERLAREVPLLALFEHPTVGALAAWLEAQGTPTKTAAVGGEGRDRARRQREALVAQRQRLAQRKARWTS
jgi:Condensation domain/Phosphopantetheine attachment site/AMP-binding enzyme C-terminal domain